jgi:hypothetical protein
MFLTKKGCEEFLKVMYSRPESLSIVRPTSHARGANVFIVFYDLDFFEVITELDSGRTGTPVMMVVNMSVMETVGFEESFSINRC